MMRRLTSNAGILLINNVGSAALAFLISVIIGRGLGAQGLGQYSFIMAWVSPLIMLADFGMGSLITRDVAKDRDTAIPLLRTSTFALIPIAGSILIIAWFVIPITNVAPIVMNGLMVAALLIILDPWYGLYTALFRAFERMWPILIINVGGLVIQVIAAILAVSTGAGLIGVIGAVVIVNVIQLAAMWEMWRIYAPEAPEWIIPPKVTELVKRAWPFALAAVLGALQLRLNVLLLEHLAGDVAVGWYAAASRFVEAGRMIPNAFFGALFPALSSLAADPDAMRHTFQRATRLLTQYAVAAGIGLTVLGGLLLRLTYDPQGTTFVGATPVLAILGWSLVPSLLRAVLTLYLYSLGREQFVNRVTIYGLVGQAILGWLLISLWGAAGAAVTMGIVEAGITVYLWISINERASAAVRNVVRRVYASRSGAE